MNDFFEFDPLSRAKVHTQDFAKDGNGRSQVNQTPPCRGWLHCHWTIKPPSVHLQGLGGLGERLAHDDRDVVHMEVLERAGQLGRVAVAGGFTSLATRPRRRLRL